jgi:hypothetical protein
MLSCAALADSGCQCSGWRRKITTGQDTPQASRRGRLNDLSSWESKERPVTRIPGRNAYGRVNIIRTKRTFYRCKASSYHKGDTQRVENRNGCIYTLATWETIGAVNLRGSGYPSDKFWNFFISDGEHQQASIGTVSADWVVHLINPGLIMLFHPVGTSYHLIVGECNMWSELLSPDARPLNGCQPWQHPSAVHLDAKIFHQHCGLPYIYIPYQRHVKIRTTKTLHKVSAGNNKPSSFHSAIPIPSSCTS